MSLVSLLGSSFYFFPFSFFFCCCSFWLINLQSSELAAQKISLAFGFVFLLIHFHFVWPHLCCLSVLSFFIYLSHPLLYFVLVSFDVPVSWPVQFSFVIFNAFLFYSNSSVFFMLLSVFISILCSGFLLFPSLLSLCSTCSFILILSFPFLSHHIIFGSLFW